MIIFYKDNNCDFLAIDIFSKTGDIYEGRAAAIAGLISSVCTTQITLSYLLSCCILVQKKDVPEEWLRAFFPNGREE